jgi:DUF971 family protein
MKPTTINASRAKRELSIVWDDGHTSRYSFSLLRAGCPCAECRGGHDKMGDTPAPAVFGTPISDSPATRLNTIVPIGSYAITPVWEDGHDAGIYQWRYLRALCPCEECRGLNKTYVSIRK